MKRVPTIILSTFLGASALLTPFSSLHAQNPSDAFNSYRVIFEQGIEENWAALETCATDAVEGFLDSVATTAVNFILDGIINFLSGEVPVGEESVRRAQKEITSAAKETSIKEQCFDSIASGISAQLTEVAINEAVTWINNFPENIDMSGDGAAGSPAFVQDIEQRLLDVAYQEYLDYMRTSTILSSTCSVFRDDVINTIEGSLDFSGSGIYDPGGSIVIPESDVPCLLDQITGGEEETRAFLAGDFSKGGWDAWHAAFNDPASNRDLAVSTAAQQIGTQIATKQEGELKRLEFNDGYLSQTECPSGSTYDENERSCIDSVGKKVNALVVTPGSTIRQIADEISTNELLRNALADELSEIFANAGRSLIGRIFGGGLSNIDPETNPIEIVGDGSIFDGAAGGGGGGGIFGGGDPAGSLIRQIATQLDFETRALTLLTQIRDRFASPDITSLIATLNQCPYILSNPEARADYETFASIPVVAVSASAGTTFEVGPQKVDWAGNDFEWVEGERYGFDMQYCTDETYQGGVDYLLNPRFSYYISRVSTGSGGYEFRWIINTCDRQGNTPRVEGHRPLAFRAPIQNRVKVDWEGNDLDWRIIDRYEGDDNRYLFNFCDSTNAGETSYHVGNYRRELRGGSSGIVEFVLEPGSLENWYRSTCVPPPGTPGIEDVWRLDTEFERSAFRNIPPDASSLDERIARVATLMGALTELQGVVEVLVEEGAGPEAYADAQNTYNTLRSTYQFSNSTEVSRLTTLYNRIDQLLPELQSIALNQCSNP